jgi:hypothetical protein
MTKSILTILIGIIVSVNLTGCSLFNSATPVDNLNSHANSDSQVPLSVSVQQAFVKDNKLHVKVRVDAKQSVKTEQVIVGVTGLNDGNITEQQFKKLNEISTGQELEPGQALALDFVLNSNAITEYQVRCSWGEDAIKLAKSLSMDPPNSDIQSARAMLNENAITQTSLSEASDSRIAKHLSEVDIVEQTIQNSVLSNEHLLTPVVNISSEKNVAIHLSPLRISKRLSSCPNKVCDYLYTVESSLINDSEKIITSVVLAVGLNWVNNGQQPVSPDNFLPTKPNEDELSIGNLQLKPDETRPLRINIDKPVPSVAGGGFQPSVRIVSVEVL